MNDLTTEHSFDSVTDKFGLFVDILTTGVLQPGTGRYPVDKLNGCAVLCFCAGSG